MNRLFTGLLFGAVTFVAHAQVPDYVPTEGLVAWYPFNGNANDESGNGNDGEVVGASITTDHIGGQSAFYFNGNGDQINIPYSASLSPTEQISVSVWCNPETLEGKNLVSNGTHVNYFHRSYYVFGPNEFGQCRFRLNAGGIEESIYSEESFNTSEWLHVIGTYDGTHMKLYVNGQLEGTLAKSGSINQHGNGTTLGSNIFYAYSDYWFQGSIDDVGIWNRALTEEEILALYNAEPPVLGCTDPTACNFAAAATSDDGSCIFAPLVDLGEDIATCEESVILDAGEGFSHYEWNTGDTSRSIVVSEAGEYSVFTSNTAPNQHALKFNGNDASAQFAESIMFGMESFSISVDCRLNDFSGNDSEPYSYIIGHPLTGGTNDHGFKIQTASNSFNGGFQAHINDEGTEHFNVISFDNSMEPNVELDQWYDLTMVVDRDNALFSFYIDGVLIDAQAIHPDFGNLDHPDGLSLGIQSIHQSSLLDGDLDNLHVWDIALNAEQIAQFQTSVPSGNEEGLVGFWNFEEGEGIEANDISGLAPSIQLNNAEWTEDGLLSMVDPACAAYDSIQISFLTSSCLDPEACNYNALAECTGEACDYTCCPGPGCCLDGTTWDADLGGCVPDGANDATANSCPHDIDFDGLIGVVDLMDLLSVFGTDCPEAGDSSGDPETAEFTCGDPVQFYAYDYSTVLIGDQCWFAENLRTEHYTNGDAIPANFSDGEWNSTTSGAVAVYGEDAGCDDYSPDGDACDPVWSLNEYGRLYNWYAVDDARGLCPTGWHVPTDGEWMTLEMELGMSESQANSIGWRGTDQGTQMKTTYGWHNGGNGSNSSGFAALPGGYRNGGNGNFDSAGHTGAWWSSSSFGSEAWFRALYQNYTSINRGLNPQDGMSVRCLKDQ